MPVNTTIESVSQATYDQFETILLNLVRTHHPDMDVRKGTALRDLLIAKAAELAAVNSGNYDHLTGLMTLQANAVASTADEELVEALLTNFDIRRQTGAAATGAAIVYVSVRRNYFVPAGAVFSYNGATYLVTAAFDVDGSGDATSDHPLLATETAGLYYFTVPVTAGLTGVAYDLAEGVELDVVADLGSGVTGASVYEAITGGVDAETLSETLARMPQSVAYKSLVSPVSISAALRGAFPAIKDLSVVGMGMPEMLRDRHNVFSQSVGGHVDVYVRTGYGPEQLVLEKTGVKVSDGVYVLTIDREDAPGFYRVRAVTDVDSVAAQDVDDSFSLAGSAYPFVEVRSADGLADTAHDFSSSNSVIETAYTVWQAGTITVTGVPAATDGTWPATRGFKLSVYWPAGLSAIQDYMDGENSNYESDCVVRGAVPCFVQVSLPVYKRSSVVLDLPAMRAAIVDLINRQPFGSSVPISQLTSLLHTFDIVRVGLDYGPGEFELVGSIRAADGTEIDLVGGSSGFTLPDLPDLLVTAHTTVLMTTLDDVSITARNI